MSTQVHQQSLIGEVEIKTICDFLSQNLQYFTALSLEDRLRQLPFRIIPSDSDFKEDRLLRKRIQAFSEECLQLISDLEKEKPGVTAEITRTVDGYIQLHLPAAICLLSYQLTVEALCADPYADFNEAGNERPTRQLTEKLHRHAQRGDQVKGLDDITKWFSHQSRTRTRPYHLYRDPSLERNMTHIRKFSRQLIAGLVEEAFRRKKNPLTGKNFRNPSEWMSHLRTVPGMSHIWPRGTPASEAEREIQEQLDAVAKKMWQSRKRPPVKKFADEITEILMGLPSQSERSLRRKFGGKKRTK